MKGLLVTLLPVVVVVLLTRLLHRPGRADPIASEDGQVVRLRMPRSKVYLGVFFTFFSVAVAPLAFGRYPFAEALKILALAAAMSVGPGLWLWAVAARQFFLSRERIEMRGYRGVSFEWGELKELLAQDHGTLQGVRFVANDGKYIVLDSGMEGWNGLLRALGEFGTEHTKPMFERALREIGPSRAGQVA